MPLFRLFSLLVLSVTIAAAQTPTAPTPPSTAEVPAPTAPPAVPAAPDPGSAPAAPAVPAPGTVPFTPPAAPAPGVVPAPPAKVTPGVPAKTPPGTTVPGRGPGAAIPGAGPAGAAGALVPSRKPARDPNVPLGDTKIVEPIEQVTLKGAELAVLYRKYTGRRVIVSAAAATAEFSFVQDASEEDPLTYAEAAELLKKAAGIENFVFMPDVKDPNLDFLTVSTRLPGIGYDVFNENAELPEGDSVISYVMTFKHLKPETAAQAFTQIIGQFGTYGSIAPLNGSVVITENTSLIRRLIKLKDEIDKPSDITGTRFISVKYADVTELAATLNDLLNNQQQAQKSAAVQRAGAPATPAVPGAPPQNAVVSSGAATSTDTPVQIIPEPRTNRVFAMGRPVDLLFVEGLIREFDIETSEKTFLRRKLNFLAVSDFLPIASDALNRAFTSTGEGGTSGATGGAAGGSANRNTRTSSGSNTGTSSGGRSSNTSRNASTTANNSSSSFGGGGSSFGGGGSSFGGGGSGGSGGGSALGNPNASTAPESRLVGRTLLVADNITNSIVVQGPPSGLEIVQRLLDQVDVKADQVMISTVIGQLSLGNSKEFGVSYLFNGSDLQGGGGGGIPAILPVAGAAAAASGAFPTVDLSNLSASGLRLYGKTGDLNIFLKALQSNSDFTVLARPSIFTANNQKGVISSGERVAIPTGSNSYGTGTASTQIQYQDVVLKLEVIPLINSENEITLQIALLNDEVNGEQTIKGAANGGDLTVPKITTREILTTVTVPNKQTIVLGGLITGKKGTSVSGIPILSSIPLVGKLFSNTTRTDDRAELLVFIQPSIVTNHSTLDDAQSDMDRRYKVSNDLRRFADGPGVLPPPNAIPPVEEKGKNGAPPKARPVTPPPASSKTQKSISPSRL